MKPINKTIVASILFTLPVIMFFGCKQYQTEEFTISNLDAKACELLQDSLSDTISTSPLTNFDSSWVDSTIYGNVDKILDSLEANKIMVTESDTSFTIITPLDIDTSYAYLFTQLDEVVFFFNDFINMSIIDTGGAFLGVENKTIPLETVYDCPEIRTRLVYKPVGERYLLQIIKTDQTLGDTLLAVILHNQ